jgi:indolepyruvate ferredoxin oxidoreductase
MGLLPVTAASLEQAIALNGVAVKLNLTAFRLGRLFTLEPDHVRRLIHSATGQSAHPQTLEEIVAHRFAHLAAYQDEAFAIRYRDRVNAMHTAEQRAASGSDTLTLVFARNYAKLLAVKDEYEVARLLSGSMLHARIAASFEDGAELSFNLAPPFLPGRAANKRPRKREFPAWIALPALRLLASLKSLRGTPLDLFGRTSERRLERDLIRDYEALVERTISRLTATNLQSAVLLLQEIESVRGFGSIKVEAMHAYTENIAAAEGRFVTTSLAPPVHS